MGFNSGCCYLGVVAKCHRHDDISKWKHFPHYWPFVWGIHLSLMSSPHKGQWSGALMFSLICVWINDWVNNREAGDSRRHRGHYDVNVMGEKQDKLVMMLQGMVQKGFNSDIWWLNWVYGFISDPHSKFLYKSSKPDGNKDLGQHWLR